ncbi:Extracellular solute-binding protein family 1 [Operophtera brumata]|uniref:Extracellular solute-binding protein family 1 n=1 Tax=Operophtera brumata TaxID=104452 RepID=A0A0L7KNS1_OPEBR|nr:Extracellular solute-binding protein family 1 [Operophtera brumata]
MPRERELTKKPIPGYLLGRNAGNEGKRNPDLLTYNLTTAADNLYKKAKRILPKSIHHNDSDKVRSNLIEIFNCTCCSCPLIDKYNLAEFIKYSVNIQVLKVMKVVQNASLYLDTLR